MSFLTGDRARAHKIHRKRRFRRSEIRLLRRVSAPALDGRVEGAASTELPGKSGKLTDDAVDAPPLESPLNN
jgi:hypothetical protein